MRCKSTRLARCIVKELFPKLDIHGGEWYPLCDNTYKYYLDKKAEHGGAWVRIIKEDSKWIYWRLGNYSKSEKEYVTLQECVDEAYNDMLRSKY